MASLSKLLAMRNMVCQFTYTAILSLQLLTRLNLQALRSHSSARIRWHFSNLCAKCFFNEVLSELWPFPWKLPKLFALRSSSTSSGIWGSSDRGLHRPRNPSRDRGRQFDPRKTPPCNRQYSGAYIQMDYFISSTLKNRLSLTQTKSQSGPFSAKTLNLLYWFDSSHTIRKPKKSKELKKWF